MSSSLILLLELEVEVRVCIQLHWLSLVKIFAAESERGFPCLVLGCSLVIWHISSCTELQCKVRTKTRSQELAAAGTFSRDFYLDVLQRRNWSPVRFTKFTFFKKKSSSCLCSQFSLVAAKFILPSAGEIAQPWCTLDKLILLRMIRKAECMPGHLAEYIGKGRNGFTEIKIRATRV